MSARRCIECGRAGLVLVEVDDVGICHGCIGSQLDGAVPEHITVGEAGSVYWWFCICGRQVRRGRYVVDLDGLAARAAWSSDRQLAREVERIEGYRRQVEGIASGGVMLCARCAAVAGSPLPAPAPPRLPGNIVEFAARRSKREALHGSPT